MSKIFPFTETWDPPPRNLRPGTSLKDLRPGTPPQKSETWDPPCPRLDRVPPPQNVNRLKLLPSPILRKSGGNKKVLLCERKRHTARCIASARYADLSPDGGGYPIQSWTGRGTPSLLSRCELTN